MEPTATAALQQAPQGRFARASAEPPPPAPPPAVALAPQPDLAATRAIARRWPRTVPPKRVFPRG